MEQNISFRMALAKDISRLVEVEEVCFDYDQLDKRKFRYFIQKGHDDLIVQTLEEVIVGYALLLFKKGSSLARLYSIAVLPEYKGMGLGQKLLEEVEIRAQEKDCSYIRLEVKKSNVRALQLYKKMGYLEFAIKAHYYDNNENAICLEKKVQNLSKANKRKVPFYAQTTDFTCGPACLLMAMKSLQRNFRKSRNLEVQIWREATTIFMTSGHGGCGPHGLALAASKRSFGVELYLSTKDILFINSVRRDFKKEIIKIVHEEFLRQIKSEKIPIHYGAMKWNKLRRIIENGGVPLVLISSYRLTDTKNPHWVVITGISEDFIFFNDPYVEKEQDLIANIDIPVRKDEFEAMAKYGSKQLQAVVAIYGAGMACEVG